MENLPNTFSATEVQHLLDVVADEEGQYPENMRAFAAALLEVLAEERPELLPMAVPPIPAPGRRCRCC